MVRDDPPGKPRQAKFRFGEGFGTNSPRLLTVLYLDGIGSPLAADKLWVS